jgi:pimeloyl-ACP methyl ester carboxylesterase
VRTISPRVRGAAIVWLVVALSVAAAWMLPPVAAAAEAGPHPLAVLIGGLGSNVPSAAADPSGGDWKLVKRRLEAAGYEVFVAATRPGAPGDRPPYAIDSGSPDWVESARRLDRQLAAAGYEGRRLVLIGHSMGGLISRVYAKTWPGLRSGCRPLGLVQLGTPNEGSEAAGLAGLFPTSEATRVLGDAADMAAFNAAYPNAERLPIYRIAGSYFPAAARAYLVRHGTAALAAVLAAIDAVYGTAANDSVVTVASVRGGPTAGWRGCATVKAMHADSAWLGAYRSDAGCVLPYRSGKRGGAAIDGQIMQRILTDVGAVVREAAQ